MTIFQYIKKYSAFSFKQKPFNEVDNVILSFLAYLEFPDQLEDGITLQSFGTSLLEDDERVKKMKQDILSVRGSLKLLKAVYQQKRYRELQLFYREQEITEISQFSAITFRFPDGVCYVAFEGTDAMISGWREDLEMAIQFPVEAQKRAISYLNRHFTFGHAPLIVGGHSKGGHLALVGSMYANFLVRRKIQKIYSNDGHGLMDFVYRSPLYKKIKERYVHIIPNYAFVGILLRNDSDYEVVSSSHIGLEAHYALYWVVEEDHFKRARLSKFSKILEQGFSTWLDQYSLEERQQFVDDVFLVFEQSDINSLIDVKKSFTSTLKLIRSSVLVSDHVKQMIKELITILNQAGADHFGEKVAMEKKEGELYEADYL